MSATSFETPVEFIPATSALSIDRIGTSSLPIDEIISDEAQAKEIVSIRGLPQNRRLRISERELHVGGAGMDIPIVPNGKPLKLTGNRVWEGTTALLDHLNNLVMSTEDTRSLYVIDLGAGTGVLGLGCHAMGAKSVVLTDLPQQLNLLESNLLENRMSECGEVRILALDWRDDPAESSAKVFDDVAKNRACIGGETLWIMAAEVLYPRENQYELVGQLFDTIIGLLIGWEKVSKRNRTTEDGGSHGEGESDVWKSKSRREHAKVFLAYKERSKGVTQAWKTRAEQDGFVVSEVQICSGDSEATDAKVFELVLPEEALADALRRQEAGKLWEASFDAAWKAIESQLQRYELGDVGSMYEKTKNTVREICASNWNTPHKDAATSGLIIWHARKVVMQYKELAQENSFDKVDCLSSTKDVVAQRAEEQKRLLTTKLQNLLLNYSGTEASAAAAHKELFDVSRSIRQLHSLMFNLSVQIESKVSKSDGKYEATIHLNGILVASTAML